jgi:hypothetical protein
MADPVFTDMKDLTPYYKEVKASAEMNKRFEEVRPQHTDMKGALTQVVDEFTAPAQA